MVEEEVNNTDGEEPLEDEELSVAEREIERALGCGDAIVEGFSFKTNVPRVARATGISARIINYIFAAIYFIVGVLCVSITEIITHVLPYIVGSMMILVGVVQLVVALIKREYRSIATNRTASSMIIAALGVMVIVESVKPDSTWAITFISIVWGVLGLFESAHAFNHAFARMASSQRGAFYLVKGFVEAGVAFMLLYQPGNHDIHTFHIIVFGINLIIDAVTMLPAVRNFLRRSASVE